MCIITAYIVPIWQRVLSVVVVLLTISIVMFSLSCNNGTSMTLATNIQDAVYAANLYNVTHQSNYVQIKTLYDDFQESNITNADVVILSKASVDKKKIIDWNRVLTIIKAKFPDGYTRISYNKMYMLSFSIPLLIRLKTTTIPVSEDTRIALQSLQAFSVKYTDITQIPQGDSLGILAFVPGIDSRFASMFSSQAEYQKWLSHAYNNTTEVLKYYRLHFGPIPYFPQLQHPNIIYKFVPSMTFFSQPPQFQHQFTQKILTYNDETIPIINPVFIGITSASKKKSYSNRFIAWILQTDSQEKIIDHKKLMLSKEPNNNTFMGNSFSTNWNTNLLSLFHINPWIWNNQLLPTQLREESINKRASS